MKEEAAERRSVSLKIPTHSGGCSVITKIHTAWVRVSLTCQELPPTMSVSTTTRIRCWPHRGGLNVNLSGHRNGKSKWTERGRWKAGVQFHVSGLRIAEAVVLQRRARDCSLGEEMGALLASGSSVLFNAFLKGGPRCRTKPATQCILIGLYILSDVNCKRLGGSGNCCWARGSPK